MEIRIYQMEISRKKRTKTILKLRGTTFKMSGSFLELLRI